MASSSPDSGSREVVLVKLGGSLLTDKRRPGHARGDVIARLARELADARAGLDAELILGHGSGSFGHVAAERHGLGDGLGDAPPLGAADTQQAAARLHRLVAEALVDAGVPAWSWAPSTALVARGGRPVSGDLRPLVAALDLGLLPVTWGDVVVDRDVGAAIASTEAVLRFLAARLPRHGRRVRRLLWLGETAGIYGRDGRTIPRVDAGNLRRVRAQLGDAAGTDVTGGIRLRLDTAWSLARRGLESLLVDGTVPGLFTAALRGDDVPGTRVVALDDLTTAPTSRGAAR